MKKVAAFMPVKIRVEVEPIWCLGQKGVNSILYYTAVLPSIITESGIVQNPWSPPVAE
jgi:hypothetical protein